jgi:hypothetical protein
MSFGNIITILGVSSIFFYSLIQILKFYGIGEEVYGYYLIFYAFMILSIIILPNNDSKL